MNSCKTLWIPLLLIVICLGCSSPDNDPKVPTQLVESYDRVLDEHYLTLNHPVKVNGFKYSICCAYRDNNKRFWIDFVYYTEESPILQDGVLYCRTPVGVYRKPIPAPLLVNKVDQYQQDLFPAGIRLIGHHMSIRVPITSDDLQNLSNSDEIIFRFSRPMLDAQEFHIAANEIFKMIKTRIYDK